MPWDAETQAAIDRAQTAVAGRKATGKAPKTVPSPFQEQAAHKATRLFDQIGGVGMNPPGHIFGQTGGGGPMLSMGDLYRTNFLGSPYRFPITAGEPSIGKLLNAGRISASAKKRDLAKKSTKPQPIVGMRASKTAKVG